MCVGFSKLRVQPPASGTSFSAQTKARTRAIVLGGQPAWRIQYFFQTSRHKKTTWYLAVYRDTHALNHALTCRAIISFIVLPVLSSRISILAGDSTSHFWYLANKSVR